MKLKARGDYEYFLLSPDFTRREANQLIGKLGVEKASASDCKNLLVHEQSKTSVFKVCGAK